MPKHVIVIGAGVAGLAAASTLVSRGIKVTLLEAASQLGGRARSVAIEYNSQVIQLDNGQHIMLGAYRDTLKLLEQVGISAQEAFMRIPLSLEQRDDNKKVFKLSTASYLPAPFNQLVGFLSCHGLSWQERIFAVRFMLRLKKSRYQLAADLPLVDFLQLHQQSSHVIKLLWEPLCLAALNTPVSLASSKVFLNVLKDTFNNKQNSDFLLPKQDLSRLFSQPIQYYLKQHGAKILLNQRVKNIQANKNGYVVYSKDAQFTASHVVIAISPVRLRNVITELPKLEFAAQQTECYRYQPIYTIYLQYDRDIKLPKPMLGLVGGVSQWVFDRGILCGQSGLMAVIISAEGKHQKYTQDTLALRVAQELRDAFPQLIKPLWHKVIAEKRATFSCDVNLSRPANLTSYPGLYLAGDYTYADYPATIEGAVRSGLACAELVCNT